MSQKFVSIADAKNNLTKLLRKISSGKHIVLTKYNLPTAVIMSYSEYENIQQREKLKKRKEVVEEIKRLSKAFKEAGSITATEAYELSRKDIEERTLRILGEK
jgi:prevent-host-death family protein